MPSRSLIARPHRSSEAGVARRGRRRGGRRLAALELVEQHLGDAEAALLRHAVGESRVGHVAELVGRLAAEHDRRRASPGASSRSAGAGTPPRTPAPPCAARAALLSAAPPAAAPAARGRAAELMERSITGSPAPRSARRPASALRGSRRGRTGRRRSRSPRGRSPTSDAPGAKSNIGERCSVDLDRRCSARPRSGRREAARGWLTCGSSSTATVSLPWLTAAGLIRTAPLITTVPVRALTITRAGASAGSTSIFSIRLISAVRTSAPCGASIATETPSIGAGDRLAERAVDRVGDALGGGEIGFGEVEGRGSGVGREAGRRPRARRVAPPGMRPDEGTLTETLSRPAPRRRGRRRRDCPAPSRRSGCRRRAAGS